MALVVGLPHRRHCLVLPWVPHTRGEARGWAGGPDCPPPQGHNQPQPHRHREQDSPCLGDVAWVETLIGCVSPCL
jgi:hypothetical protein